MTRWVVLLWVAAASVAQAAEPLTLERAVSLALSRNERVGASSELAQASNARLSAARSFFFPTVSITGVWTRQPPTQVRSANGLQATGAISVLLFDGRVVPLYRMASHDAQAAQLDLKNQERLVAFETADAFLQTLGYQQVAEAAQKRVALAKQSLEEAQVRFKAGLVSSNDVTRAEVELATAQQGAIRSEGDAKNSLLQLSFLIASEIDGPLQPVDIAIPQNSIASQPPELLVRQAVEARPDVNAAKERILSANAFADEPLWRWVPSLSAAGQFRESNKTSILAPSEDWSAQLILTWTLLDPTRFADRAQRLALARAQKLNTSYLERQVATEVKTSLVSLQVADAAVREAKVAAEVARKSAEETQVLYREGLARAIEVSDATQRLFEAEVSLAQERYARGVSFLNLRSSVGEGPLGGELQP